PGVLGRFAVGAFLAAPPLGALGELLVAHGSGLRVALAALWRVDLVEPGLLRGAGLVEEEKVRGDLSVRREDTLGEAHDGVQVALFHKLLLDFRADTFTEQRTVREDDCAPALRL